MREGRVYTLPSYPFLSCYQSYTTTTSLSSSSVAKRSTNSPFKGTCTTLDKEETVL